MKKRTRGYSIYGLSYDPFGVMSEPGNCFGTHGLWFEPDGRKSERRDKYEAPYSYSEFFLIGNHESVEGAGADYSDRYASWDVEKFENAWRDTGKGKGWTRMTSADCSKFVKKYYGEKFEFCGLVEGCNASNGYPYWIIFYKEKKK